MPDSVKMQDVKKTHFLQIFRPNLTQTEMDHNTPYMLR